MNSRLPLFIALVCGLGALTIHSITSFYADETVLSTEMMFGITIKMWANAAFYTLSALAAGTCLHTAFSIKPNN